MKEQPIIFSGEMVRAILEGRKTQTRRVVKRAMGIDLQKAKGVYEVSPSLWQFSGYRQHWTPGHNDDEAWVLCGPSPYGMPGDRLYVKERWRPSWANVAGMVSGPGIEYEDGTILGRPEASRYPECETPSRSKWRSSRFMPRFASRILLEVTDIRVERVQDISEEDAKAEGIAEYCGEFTFNGGMHLSKTATSSFRHLWDSINAKRGHGWDSNPWVWVVTFKRI